MRAATHPFWLSEDAPEQVIARVAPLEDELRGTRERLDVAMARITQLTTAASRAEGERRAAVDAAAAAKIAELERLVRKYAPTQAATELAAMEKRLAANATHRAAAMALAKPGRDAQ